jgi:hypothetical protein
LFGFRIKLDYTENDIDNLVSWPISHHAHSLDPRNTDTMAMTIIHRLAHLIYRVKRNGYSLSTTAAAWYLKHLDMYLRSVNWEKTYRHDGIATIKLFRTRLEKMILDAVAGDAHIRGYSLARGQEILASYVGELENLYPPCPVIATPNWGGGGYPRLGTPRGDLDYFITNWMWLQGTFDY